MRARFRLGIPFIAALALCAQAVGEGVTRTRIGPLRDNAFGLIVQNDGKLVSVGTSHNGVDSDIALVRHYANGGLDFSFGSGGVALLDSHMGEDQGYNLVQQPDGKIVVVGTYSNGRNKDFLIARFHHEGGLDTTFGYNGIVQ